MADIETLAKVIVNSNALLGKKIEALTKAVGNTPSPVVNVPRANISVNPPEISVQPTEVNPQVHVEAPNVTVEPTKVVIDNEGVKKLLKQILDKKEEKVDLKDLNKISKVLTKISEVNREESTPKTNEEYATALIRLSESLTGFDVKVDELLKEMEKAVRSGGNMQRQGGGSSGTVFVKNEAGDKVNPSVAVSDFEELSTTNPQGTQVVGDFGGEARYIQASGEGEMRIVNRTDREQQENIERLLQVISIKLDVLQPFGGPMGLDEFGELRESR